MAAKSRKDLCYDHLRRDVCTLFDVFCEVDGSGEKPTIKSIYPADFNDERLLRSVCEFSFPCGTGEEAASLSDDAGAVQMFTFLLIDGETCYTFGFCKYTPNAKTCTCFLSGYPFTSLFYKLLNHLSMVERKSPADLESVLGNAYHIDVPAPHQMLQLIACPPQWHFKHVIPDVNSLVTLNDDKLMLEFYNILTEKQMIILYTSMLMERRIIITATKLGQLTSCCFALSKLIWPFHWQCLFSPIVPMHLGTMLGAPLPYIMGIPRALFDSNREVNFEDCVIADLDNKTIHTPFKDALPNEVHNFLKHQLKLSSQMFLSDSFSRTFLRANVILFGKYRLGFVKDPQTDVVNWDSEKFVNESRASLQPFLRTMIVSNGCQFFDGFITERLKRLRNGVSSTSAENDEFEREILAWERKEFSSNRSLSFSTMNASSLLPNNAPEAFQNAVSNVKDNATDVIGALKGKVQSISIRSKFGRLTPKHSRKSGSSSTSHGGTRSGSKSKPSLNPLSVDATAYHFDGGSSSGSTPTPIDSPSSQRSLNLIDFSVDSPTTAAAASSKLPVEPDDLLSSSAPAHSIINGTTQKPGLNGQHLDELVMAFDPFVSRQNGVNASGPNPITNGTAIHRPNGTLSSTSVARPFSANQLAANGLNGHLQQAHHTGLGSTASFSGGFANLNGSTGLTGSQSISGPFTSVPCALGGLTTLQNGRQHQQGATTFPVGLPPPNGRISTQHCSSFSSAPSCSPHAPNSAFLSNTHPLLQHTTGLSQSPLSGPFTIGPTPPKSDQDILSLNGSIMSNTSSSSPLPSLNGFNQNTSPLSFDHQTNGFGKPPPLPLSMVPTLDPPPSMAKWEKFD